LTTEDAKETDTDSQAFGVSEEVSALYADDFEVHLSHVESVFEVDPDAPNQSPQRTEYKVYKLVAKAESE
jgi:thiopurine S-methyltransferase